MPALRLLVEHLLAALPRVVVRLRVERLLVERLLAVRLRLAHLRLARPRVVQAQARGAQSIRATARIGRPLLQSPA